MKRDLYLEWINNETLEKGFKDPLWTRVLEESRGDQIAAKILYVERRKAQLIAENFIPPLYEQGEELTRVPRREIPQDFVDRNPQLVRVLGLALSVGLLFFGFWMIKRYGLQ